MICFNQFGGKLYEHVTSVMIRCRSGVFVKHWLRGIVLGLVAAEVSWTALGWRGLTVLDNGRQKILGLAAIIASCPFMQTQQSNRSLPRPFSLARGATMVAGMALGGVLQLLLAGLRRRNLSPLDFFMPGEREQYQVEAIHIPLSDGAMPGLLFAPPAAEHAVVMLHGAGAQKTFYTWPLIERLVEHGYAVCTVDLDGHGDNERPLDFPQVLEDPQAAVSFMRQRYRKVGLIGTSLGGCLAARAVADGLQVDALALIAAPIEVPYTPAMRRREYWTLARSGTWALHRSGGTLPLIRAWRCRQGQCKVDALTLIRLLDLEGSVRRLRLPVLLCYGGDDLIAPPDHARRLQRSAPSGTSLHLTPGATHLSLSLDERALRALVQWLDRQWRPAATAPAALLSVVPEGQPAELRG